MMKLAAMKLAAVVSGIRCADDCLRLARVMMMKIADNLFLCEMIRYCHSIYPDSTVHVAVFDHWQDSMFDRLRIYLTIFINHFILNKK